MLPLPGQRVRCVTESDTDDCGVLTALFGCFLAVLHLRVTHLRVIIFIA